MHKYAGYKLKGGGYLKYTLKIEIQVYYGIMGIRHLG